MRGNGFVAADLEETVAAPCADRAAGTIIPVVLEALVSATVNAIVDTTNLIFALDPPKAN
ncbi:MAG TPA: hypothetical protein VNG89_08285 [Vicinamibacterales bacterium]|nr:hypothetical protein [Vicinamibacterales bacterium]